MNLRPRRRYQSIAPSPRESQPPTVEKENAPGAAHTVQRPWWHARPAKFSLPLQLGVLHLVLTGVGLYYVWIFSQNAEADLYDHGARLWGSLLMTVVVVNLEARFVLAVAGSRRWLRALCGTLILLLTFCFLAYRVEAKATFDPYVVVEHRNEQLTREVLKVIFSSLDRPTLQRGLGIAIILLWIEWVSGLGFPAQSARPRRRALVSGCLLVLSFQSPVIAYDEVSEVLRPLARWSGNQGMRVPLRPGEYPLVHATAPSAFSPVQKAKKIFLIMVESFNANFVEAKAPNGKAYTPYFNSLIPQGLYVDRFYGNSVQTAKGQFATLCSLLPAMRGREFVRLADAHLRCLPTILGDAGFKSVFFQAYRHINYDNTRNFLKHIGFTRVETVDAHLQMNDDKLSWGWGLQDDVFYRRFFEYLDNVYDRTDTSLFVTLAPISNHMRFGDVPESERRLYPDPSTPAEKFANSINVADRGLAAFMQELRRRERFQDALVIITGDHSFPVGEHGYHHNETNAYEEFFRIPFLMLAPKDIAPERVHDVAYSQLDIAPTLLDYTGVMPAKTHFMGVSVFARPFRQHAIPIIQPYSGTYLGIIDFPFKYVFHIRDERARLVNLVLDPREEHNLASDSAYDARKGEMHRSLDVHKVAATACALDQVWPAAADK